MLPVYQYVIKTQQYYNLSLQDYSYIVRFNFAIRCGELRFREPAWLCKCARPWSSRLWIL